MRGLPVCVLTLLICSSAGAYDGKRDNDPTNVRRVPRAGVDLPADIAAELTDGYTSLGKEIAALRNRQDPAITALLPDIMIFERAVRCAVQYDEFFSPKDFNKARGLLQEGHRRVRQLADGDPQWTRQSGLVVRGFVSRIDDTVQPYGVVVPATYDFGRSQPVRCDVWFHGRGETLSEVNFLWDRMNNVGRYAPADTIVLHPYGRYSNAFKFAGETDVLEALADTQQRYRIDDDRISVRGFSMGGAACWQFAVHYPDRWFAANPGAGFSETPRFLKFFQKETLQPQPWEKALWNLYDCDRYAGNLAALPTIAYSGENDIQKQAADVMEAALLKKAIRLRHVIGPDMGHNIDEGSKRIIERAMTSLARTGRRAPALDQHLETHTLKYNTSGWITIDGLIEHWKPASVTLHTVLPERPDNGIQIFVRTRNVSAFSLDIPAGTFAPAAGPAEKPFLSLLFNERGSESVPELVRGEGPFSDGSATASAHLGETGGWEAGPLPPTPRQKVSGLQGPIDDAFMDAFVFVKPTGRSGHPKIQAWVESEMQRAIVHWRRHFRGDAIVVADTDVTPEMMASRHLVLWGDPQSNQLLRQVAPQLPIAWSAESIQTQRHAYDARHHVPVLIYPNPLQPTRYVVLNSSFTYRDYAYLNNARQVPMLPDWAIINVDTPPGNVWPGEVVEADFFDEGWRLK